MLRYGWGVTATRTFRPVASSRPTVAIAATRFTTSRVHQSIVAGFRQAAQGNPDLKWEENRSTNIGADMVLFNGLFNVVIDVYNRKTSNLLFDPRTPAAAGIADPPIVNIGKMENKGFDFSIGHTASWWNIALNGSHYKNKIVSIDGVQDYFFGPNPLRIENVVINQVGQPIGSFFGLVTDGYFRDQADATAHLAAGNCGVGTGLTGVPCQDGAAPGRFKFKDLNGDGTVDARGPHSYRQSASEFHNGYHLGAHRGHGMPVRPSSGPTATRFLMARRMFMCSVTSMTNLLKDRLLGLVVTPNQNAKYPILDNQRHL